MQLPTLSRYQGLRNSLQTHDIIKKTNGERAQYTLLIMLITLEHVETVDVDAKRITWPLLVSCSNQKNPSTFTHDQNQLQTCI